MTLQLGMSREDRDPADVLTSWALKEYERLQQEAPPVGAESIALFNKKFDKDTQAIPDVAEDKFVIKVFNPQKSITASDVEILSNQCDIDVRQQ